MTNRTIARRYAQALYEEAAYAQYVERIDEDVAMIRDALRTSRDLVLFFESPIISREQKERVVHALFADRVHATTLNFLRLLIEKRREDLFPDVVAAYHALRDEHLGIIEAKARVAFPLDQKAETQLVKALEQMTGTHVRLKVEEDAGLVGGLVVRIGDTVYDGSVRHQLISLRERMEYGAFARNGTGTA